MLIRPIKWLGIKRERERERGKKPNEIYCNRANELISGSDDGVTTKH